MNITNQEIDSTYQRIDANKARDVTTAAEIVDGCEAPDKSDIEHMLNLLCESSQHARSIQGSIRGRTK